MEKTAFEIGVEEAIEKLALSLETIARAYGKRSGQAYHKASGGLSTKVRSQFADAVRHPVRQVKGVGGQMEFMFSDKGQAYQRALGRKVKSGKDIIKSNIEVAKGVRSASR